MEKYDFAGPFLQRALYATLKTLEQEANWDHKYNSFFELIDFDSAGISETALQIWYSEYEEYLQKNREHIKQVALCKLTLEERRALGA